MVLVDQVVDGSSKYIQLYLLGVVAMRMVNDCWLRWLSGVLASPTNLLIVP